MHLISNRAQRVLAISSGALRAFILVAALGAPAVPVAAQYGAAAPADPGTSLATSLRTLSNQPRDFQALIAAGRASLDMGDTQAAAGFYGRAEEVSPQSPVPKIGMGAAMTAMGDARGAMTYFDRASALGSPQSLLALDRGLAFDLLGQQSKAQSDYRAAMFGTQIDEARRRLALSLAISKDSKGAAAMLAPLLARHHAGAVRTNAFVLALGGDREGARRAIDAAMPGAGARFEPFFRMLPLLRADEKAMAVHLGEFPKDAAQRYASAERTSPSPALTTASQPGLLASTSRPTPQVQITPPMNARVKPPVTVAGSAPRPVQAAPAPAPVPLASLAMSTPRPYQSPQTSQVQTTPPVNAPVKSPVTVADHSPRAVQSTPTPLASLAMSRPLLDPSRHASTQGKPEAAAAATPKKEAEPDPEPRPGFSVDELAPVAEAPEPLLPVKVGAVLNRAGEPILSSEALPPPPPAPTPKLEIKPPLAPKPKVELAKLDLPKAKPAKPKVEAEKPKPKPKAEAEKPKAKEAAKKKPFASPYFVQLASGANADRMAGEFKKIKAKKPTLFAGRLAQVTNGKELFRLVVGPFKSRDDSGEFVNQLAKAGIDGFTYTAPDGMTFEKIATK